MKVSNHINKKVNFKKLKDFGFAKDTEGFVYHTKLLDGQFVMKIVITYDGEMITQVIDAECGDEYVLHHVKSSAGAFVGQVREEYECVLNEIFSACFDLDVYKNDQTKAVIKQISKKYGHEPEFLWDDENSVVRRTDNGKWYAAFLKVSARKIGMDSDEVVEIVNVKMKPEDVKDLIDSTKYFPAYHMNKKHWVTIPLEGYIETSEILSRIHDSFKLADIKFRKKHEIN